MENPLHPFELHQLVHLSLFGIDISINKAVLMMWVVVGLAATLLIMGGSSRRLVPTKLQSLAELLVDFIRGIILDTMGKDGMRFFPFVATLFVFILFCNLLGLIPGSYTVTSQIVVTAAFAIFVYSMSVVLGFLLHGVKFFGILAVRLFANMTAGHTILAVLFGMVISIPLIPVSQPVRIALLVLLIALLVWRRRIIAQAGVWGLALLCLLIPVILSVLWIRWLPFAFTLFMNGLEVGIAGIQAYIFTILTCVYLGDAITLHGHDESHAH